MPIIIGLLIQYCNTFQRILFMKLKHLKALCKTLEDYENKCGDAEIDFLIDGKVYTPATFECNLDDRGNVWGLVINLELED